MKDITMTLNDIKAGDAVVIFAGYSDPELRKVARVTKTTIILEPKFENGHQPIYNKPDGHLRGKNRWDVNYIEVPTPDMLQTMKLNTLRKTLKHALTLVSSYKDLSEDECLSVLDVVKNIIDKRHNSANIS